MAAVELTEYDADWPLRFVAIQQHTAPHLPPGTVVEHVGSTAVPGMVGKPVIDVDVVVQDVHMLAEAVPTLASRERYTLVKGELVTTLLADARIPAGSS